MKVIVLKVIFLLLMQYSFSVFSQNITESLKAALVYKIALHVKWAEDTSSYFKIGVLSTNEDLQKGFKELTKLGKLNTKIVKIIPFSSVKSLQAVHLLYVDSSNNSSFSSILKTIGKQNTLLVSEEYQRAGEIMVNLKMEKNRYTFEYNRANILFQGLELNDKIVLLKGSEIEIRELYLQAKKLWDEQKEIVETLKVQSETQNKNLKIQKDSVILMKKNILNNQRMIEQQTHLIAQKDSLSRGLNFSIKQQQDEIFKNRFQIEKFLKERSGQERLILNYQDVINDKKNLSDSLEKDIGLKIKELELRKKSLNEKETLIKQQSYWLWVSFGVITVVLILISLIYRAYLLNKRTKQKLAEQKEELEATLEKLQSTQQQLVQSEKMASLGVLVAGIAHEINNPVNFINSGIQGIEKVFEKMITLLNELNKLSPESTNEELKNLLELKNKLKLQSSMQLMPEVIDNIKMGVRRTIEITSGLRLYARMDREEKSKYDINQVIDTALLLLKSKLEKRIDIIKEYQTLPAISVYPGKLSQVFINLISNSIDAIDEQTDLNETPYIRIRTKVLKDNISIEFSDTGKGIPAEIMDKLFDPFFTTKVVGKGTGLGLSITQGIIEEHLGTINVQNNLPKGATFIIELPINQ